MDHKPAMGGAGRVIPVMPAGGPRLAQLPPLSLYIHLPWCLRKCPYCDFNSHEAHGGVPEDDYVAALVADLEAALPLVWGRRVHSVFLGGGTPSLFSPRALDALLCAVRARLAVAPDAEITLEANPGTFESEKFRAYRELGINRLSVGIQSFDARHLAALGRIHDAREARRAVEIAARHFDNFNLDLMYGLPGQTLAEAEADLAAALEYAPPHLSLYNLTLEPNTLFHHAPPDLPDEEACADMQDMIEARCGAAGYMHYEVSAYARPGRQCRHNLNYWRFGDYLGIGAGAHGKISTPERILRQMRWKQPKRYMEEAMRGSPAQEEHDVGAADLPFEFMMNALRLAEGVEEGLFAAHCGLPLAVLEARLDEAMARGLLRREGGRIAATPLGWRHLNTLLQVFL